MYVTPDRPLLRPGAWTLVVLKGSPCQKGVAGSGGGQGWGELVAHSGCLCQSPARDGTVGGGCLQPHCAQAPPTCTFGGEEQVYHLAWTNPAPSVFRPHLVIIHILCVQIPSKSLEHSFQH